MSDNNEREQNTSLVFSRRIVPIISEEKTETEKKNIKISWLNRIVSFLKGQTIEDIKRLKEAGLRLVEAKATKEIAEANYKFAKAEKEFAEAESVRILNEKKMRKVEIDAAVQSLHIAISVIKQNGGNVLFDSDELDALLHLSNLDKNSLDEIKLLLKEAKK